LYINFLQIILSFKDFRKWRKSHNEELKDLYSLPNIVQVVKSRRWARHVARMGEERGVHRVLLGTPSGKDATGKIHT
jgi:hypothetical protein